MALQTTVNIQLAYGVPGELLFKDFDRAISRIVNSNGTPNYVGYAFTQNATTGVASVGGIIGGATGTFVGNISGTTLTVTSVSAGNVQIGQTITGGTIAGGTTITGFLTGVPGGPGTYSVSSSQTVTGSPTITATGGTPIVWAGILVNPKEYVSSGTTSGTLAPTLAVPDNYNGAFMSSGVIVVQTSTSCNIGDQVQYNALTGAISTVAPGASASSGNILIPNGTVWQSPQTGAGLISIKV